MIKLLKDITTGPDNSTHEIARVVMVANALLLVPILFVGVVAYVYGWHMGKPFDVQTLFTGVLTYEAGVGTLLTTGSAAIFFKRTVASDGSSTETESITKGKQPDVNTTIINNPV